MALLAALTACHDPKALAPTRANFTAALDDYLAQRGHLCVAKYDWPIAVTDADVRARSLDAQQMPYLETLGLVTRRDTAVTRKGPDGTVATVPAREYALSAQGQKYYLHVPVVVATPAQRVTHAADLCVATLTLDRLFGWEKPQTIDGRTATSLLFSYRIVDPELGPATERRAGRDGRQVQRHPAGPARQRRRGGAAGLGHHAAGQRHRHHAGRRRAAARARLGARADGAADRRPDLLSRHPERRLPAARHHAHHRRLRELR